MDNYRASAILLLLVAAVKGQFNCCNQLELSSSGVAGNHQGNRLGIYHLYDVQDQRPIYKQEDRQEFLFYLVSNTKGLWMVGPHVGQFNGGLAHRGDNKCVQNVRSGQWKYTDGAAWHRDSKLKIACLDQTVDCLYKDGWELEGSDLPTSLGGGGLATSTSASCIEECQLRPSCHYWTFIKDNSTNCFLKMSGGELVQREGYLTGSIPKACGAPNTRRITPTTPTVKQTTTERAVAKDDQNEKFNDKEINGKFKITSLKWNNKLNDKNSRHFRDLSASIEDSLLDMFHREKELNEKLNFTVTVEKFKKGSVVCNFKVNYALREAYVAIPFVIKPSNITETLSKNFRFKKGILFQRFLIAAGSFNASSPVDHCAAKGCSHKCNYDYDIEDYVCTCPPSLALNVDQRTCVPKDQQNKNLNDQETDKPDTTTTLKTDSEQDNKEDNEVSNEEDEEEATTEVNMKNNNQDEEAATEVNDNNEVNTEPNEANNEEENTEDSNEEEDELDEDGSPIVLTLLPADCLWSPWSLWSPCTCSGGIGKAERTRDVLMEERNGGACPGEPKHTVECQMEEKCPETDADDVITQELDDDIITQELDDVTPTEASSDDDIFPDDGSILFGDKLPKEGDENNPIDDQESTTVDIHDYETTLKPDIKYKDSDTFRKDGDATADSINDDPDANDNDINDEETGTTANPENVTSGDEDMGNVQESNTDDEDPDDMSKEVDERNVPNNSITFPDDNTKDNSNDDELTELFLPDIKNNATDTPLDTDNEIDTTPTNVSEDDEVTTDGNKDHINGQNEDDTQNSNDINDVIDNRFPESRIIDEETTTQKMDEAGNGIDSNTNDSEDKKMDKEETTTNEFPEDNNATTSHDENNDDTDNKQDSNGDDSKDNNENNETTTQKMDESGNGIDSNSDEMTTQKMDEPGNGIDSNSEDVDGKMNEDENTTTPKMNEPGNGIDNNSDDIDIKMKDDEDTTTKAIPELNNENDVKNSDDKDKDNTLEEVDSTTTTSIPEDTTDMSNDKNDNDINVSKGIDEENDKGDKNTNDNDSDDEDEENNNNTTENNLDEESENIKEDNDIVQPSEVTPPSVVMAGDATEDSSLDEEEVSTIKSISTMDNNDSDSTPFPILNQINGIDSDDETTTINTETTIKAIPMSDILEVGDYPESDEVTPTTPESTNSESNTNNPDTSEISEDSPITTESSSDDNPTTLDSNQDYPVTSESSGSSTDEDYPATSESNEDYPTTSDDSPVTLESSGDSEVTSESNQDLPLTTESTKGNPTTSQSNQDSPVTSESGGESPVTSESSQDSPTTSESSEENPSTPQSSEENLTTSESSENNPTTSPSNQDNQTTSKSSEDNPATSKSSDDGPITTESSEDYTLTVDSNDPITTESTEDKSVTTESTEDNSITTESTEDNSITTESSEDDDNSETTESSADGDVSATTESSFTTILVPLNEVTTMSTLDGKMGRNNLDNKDDENHTEGAETTTTQQDVLEMGDITTISSTLIEETTTDEGLLKFNCSESSRDDLNISSNQMPMDCILQNGLGEVTKKHVIIILNKDSFDSSRLFEDNIKLIAKNVMLMDISKR